MSKMLCDNCVWLLPVMRTDCVTGFCAFHGKGRTRARVACADFSTSIGAEEDRQLSFPWW